MTEHATKPVEMLDAVVLGAGFAGLAMLNKLRNGLGLTARAYDKADGVGGTWYWNRYPGARSDTESWVYCYSFDPVLYREWQWTERYPRQPEILAYLEHVTDRFDLRRSIQFSTTVTSAHYNEATDRWDIQTDKGDRVSAKWLITGLGLLSAPNMPTFKGMENFKGEIYHTARWPKTRVDFAGKRVGVIGTGSTGVQVVSDVAARCGHLTLFQRRPQYSVPAQNHPAKPDMIAKITADLDGYFNRIRRSATCFSFQESDVPAMSVSAEERERVFEKAWEEGGGFNFMFGTFNDIAVDPAANEAAADFIRRKIATLVKDPRKRELLTPRDYYARRPLCDNHYFEALDRDNVTIADVLRHPIVEFTPTGVRTEEGDFELDIVIFATGFDAVTGNFVRIDFQGRGGEKLKDKWADGPVSYLGLSIVGFPNMFTLYGPPGPFTNQPPAIEWQVEWVGNLIAFAEKQGIAAFEATREAEEAWMADCIAIAESTLFAKLDWWVMGTNIPGKPRAVSFYMGGFGNYMDHCMASERNGYAGFALKREKVAA
jgi:cation diffusion facilitator CzcD-associated flavoprotein CzcO